MAEQDAFHTAMDAASVEALWEIFEGRYGGEPEPTHIWSWSDLEPLFSHAVQGTQMEDAAQRRVLCLKNPNYDGDSPAISHHFSVNLQILMPGEHAAPHRHSIHAMRFVLEGGAVTTVDGKECIMERGDLVLTPAWAWHEHNHPGTERAVWVDILDVPMHRYFDTAGWENGPVRDMPERTPDSAYQAPGMIPEGEVGHGDHSLMYRYPWENAVRALDASSAEDDGSRLLRYVNPASGGSVMNRLDVYLLGLTKGKATTPGRSTANAACVVAEGAGKTKVGDNEISWSKNDIFTLPHGNWITHTASDPDTKLFVATDREVLRRLELLQEEVQE